MKSAFPEEIKCFGFIINVDEGIKVDLEKMRAIASWEAPKDVKGAQSMMGFANFYRNLIEKFAQISAPLQALTNKGISFRWEEHQETFDKFKSKFITAPILAVWDGDHETILETDASGWATAECLSLFKTPGKLQPIAYYSKRLL